MAEVLGHELTAVRIPHAHAAVGAAGRKLPPVERKRQAIEIFDQIAMVSYHGSGSDVVDHHSRARPVRICQKTAAVARIGPEQAWYAQQLLPGADVPNPRARAVALGLVAVIEPDGDQHGSIG